MLNCSPFYLCSLNKLYYTFLYDVRLSSSQPAMDSALEDLVHYFDATYVTGSMRNVQRPVTSHGIQPLRLRRIPSLFHDATLTGEDRTNNMCESMDIGTRTNGH